MRISDWSSDVCSSDLRRRQASTRASLKIPISSTFVASQREHSFLAPVYITVWVSGWRAMRSEEHTSELQSLMRISYAVFCLKKKNQTTHINTTNQTSQYNIAT